MATLTFTFRCVGCKHVEKMAPGGSLPMCPKCYSVMVVTTAATR